MSQANKSPYRRGIVLEVSPQRARARVRFPDRNTESGWLEVLQQGAGQTESYWLPDQDELVACLMDERDEAGCILGSLYSMKHLPPNPNQNVRRVTFPGGVVVEYERESKRLLVSGVALVEVSAGTKVSVTAPAVELTGPTKITGTAEVTGASTLTGGATVAGGSSPAVKSTPLLADLTTLKGAIAAAPCVPLDGGLAFKESLVAALGAFPNPAMAATKLSTD